MLIEFLSNQGKEKPQNSKEYGDWLSRVGEAVAVLAMVHEDPDVQVISNVLIYASSRGDDKKWKGKWLAALGDRNEKGEDPPFVRLKASYFEWRGVKLPSDPDDSGPMATYYDKRENEGEFCSLEGVDLDIEQTHVPKFCLVPAKIALDALELGLTPWEVYEALVEFEDGLSDAAKELLQPCKDWALAAALRGDNGAETSKMAYILTPISGATPKVVKELKNRLVGTLGAHVQPQPTGKPPTFSEQNVRDIAREAVQSVADARSPHQNNAGGDFQEGILTAMRMLKEQESDPNHKPFSNVTKGKLMGMCGVTKWCNMPTVWAEIEACKTDRDLRTILQNHWGKNKKDLNTMFYDIYWGEELLKSIRIADFTRSNMATFLTSELGLSMMLLLPRTEEEIILMDAEWERRRRAGKNVTTADYKAAEKAPRMPPLRWDEVCLLFTTWALMLKMLFGERNAHLLGLNSIRQHVMTLSSTKHLYNTQYFANIVWCVLDDAVRSFNQVMPYEDLVTANELTILQFPTTRLHQVANTLSLQSDFSMATFPREWRMHAER